MSIRKIVKIDCEKCNGCGICVPNCAEGAVKIIEGKAQLVSENLCDGLGACLGNCPLGAITIIEREAADFEPHEVEKAKKVNERMTAQESEKKITGCNCPGSAPRRLIPPPNLNNGENMGKTPSSLRNWPVKIKLSPISATYYENADLLICADCVPFAFPDLHTRLMKGKVTLTGCPKLDNAPEYTAKLSRIFAENHIKSATVAHMEVPCCSGLLRLVQQAIDNCGKNIDFDSVKIPVNAE